GRYRASFMRDSLLTVRQGHDGPTLRSSATPPRPSTYLCGSNVSGFGHGLSGRGHLPSAKLSKAPSTAGVELQYAPPPPPWLEATRIVGTGDRRKFSCLFAVTAPTRRGR